MIFLRYVLSPTHLHEFKSADKNQAPIMSLYLPEQKLGSHSTFGASSNKFMLKGRQTGAMHRGHSWVFRAESYETMLAWVSHISFRRSIFCRPGGRGEGEMLPKLAMKIRGVFRARSREFVRFSSSMSCFVGSIRGPSYQISCSIFFANR